MSNILSTIFLDNICFKTADLRLLKPSTFKSILTINYFEHFSKNNFNDFYNLVSGTQSKVLFYLFFSLICIYGQNYLRFWAATQFEVIVFIKSEVIRL